MCLNCELWIVLSTQRLYVNACICLYASYSGFSIDSCNHPPKIAHSSKPLRTKHSGCPKGVIMNLKMQSWKACIYIYIHTHFITFLNYVMPREILHADGYGSCGCELWVVFCGCGCSFCHNFAFPWCPRLFWHFHSRCWSWLLTSLALPPATLAANVSDIAVQQADPGAMKNAISLIMQC